MTISMIRIGERSVCQACDQLDGCVTSMMDMCENYDRCVTIRICVRLVRCV